MALLRACVGRIADRHSFSPYFEGMDKPFKEYDSEENQKQYELEQRQRELERRIRKTKQETMTWRHDMEHETDPVKKAQAEEKYQRKAALLQRQNKAYNEFCEETGQKKRHDRIQVAKWNRSEAAKARGAAKKAQKSVANSSGSGTIKLPDVEIGRSLGAKAKNYKVMNLATGEMYEFVEGTRLQNVEVFAGKGSKKPYRNAYKYADAYGGKAEDWQHVKGDGWIACVDEERPAEVHWSQCEGIGKFDFFVKRWKDED